MDSNKASGGRIAPKLSYTRGRDLSGRLEGTGGIGGLLARSVTAYPYTNWTDHAYYFADGNGNVTYMLDSSQSMVASYRYDPFGNMISSSGTLADDNVYRFSSKEIHVNSGMYYYLYRFYDPNLQRWINRDPIGERGGFNLYVFVHNEILNRVDLFGLSLFGNPIPRYVVGPELPPKPPQIGPPGFSVNPLPPWKPRPCTGDQCLDSGGHYDPYWKIMGYSDQDSCASDLWNLNRDEKAGALGIVGGAIVGAGLAGPLGGIIGGAAGGYGATVMTPNGMCAQLICIH